MRVARAAAPDAQAIQAQRDLVGLNRDEHIAEDVGNGVRDHSSTRGWGGVRARLLDAWHIIAVIPV